MPAEVDRAILEALNAILAELVLIRVGLEAVRKENAMLRHKRSRRRPEAACRTADHAVNHRSTKACGF